MLDVARLGGLVGAIAYAVLAVLLATRWRERMRGSLLLTAVALTVVWALLGAYDGLEVGIPRLVLEMAKGLAWIVFLRRAFSGTGQHPLPRTLTYGPPALALGTVLVALWSLWGRGSAAAAADVRHIWAGGGLAMALFGIVLVEQALRNTRSTALWSMKFVWLGVGTIFAFDIALYSTSYALGEIAPLLLATRGFAVAMAVPLLAIGVSRVGGFNPQTLMSPRLAFHAASMLVAGLYITAVAFAAWYVRVVGGRWGDALLILFLFAATIGFAVVLSSGVVRARVRVSLAKHLFPYKHDYRTAWLELTNRLSRDADGLSLAERTLEAFKHLTHSPAGVVFALREDTLQYVAGDFLKSTAAVAEPVAGPFCQFLAEREWLVKLDAARAGEGPDGEVPLPAWLRDARDAWLAIPLVHETRIHGLVVLRRPHAPQALTWEDLDLLRTAARQAASYFAIEVAGDALARERQFAAMNRLTAFLMHDLSNIHAQQRLIVENAVLHRAKPAFVDDAFATIENTVKRTGLLLEQFRAGAATGAPRRVALETMCVNAVERASVRTPRPELRVADSDLFVQVPPERLDHVLEHVIRNAQDATASGGTVTISVRAVGDAAEIDVADSGVGMDGEFVRTRLFKPFDTTKGAKGMGIGAFQTREFVRSCGGDVSVTSTPGSGTSFVIRLPRVP